MKTFDDIGNLWQRQEVKANMPEASQIIKKIEKMRRKLVVKHTIGIVLLMLTFIYTAPFLFVYEFELITTYIGIVIVLMSIVLGIAFQNQLIGIILPKSDVLTNPRKNLEQSLIYQARLRYLNKTGVSTYYILLSLGLTLYIYEFASRDLWFGILIYAITGAWALFSWFYLRRRSIERQQKKIDEHIDALRKVLKGFNDE